MALEVGLVGMGGLPRHLIFVSHHLSFLLEIEQKISLEYTYILLISQCVFPSTLYFSALSDKLVEQLNYIAGSSNGRTYPSGG